MESFSGMFLQFIADWGYVAVAVLVMLISSGVVSGLSTLFSLSSKSLWTTVIKVVVDTILYFINYRVQKNWVFAPSRKGGEGHS